MTNFCRIRFSPAGDFAMINGSQTAGPVTPERREAHEGIVQVLRLPA